MNSQQRAALEQAAKDLSIKKPYIDSDRAFIKGAEWMEQSQWIPVKERLPEKKERVIISKWYPVTDGKDWDYAAMDYTIGDWNAPFKVTHWMDFNPSPPKEENNG